MNLEDKLEPFYHAKVWINGKKNQLSVESGRFILSRSLPAGMPLSHINSFITNYREYLLQRPSVDINFNVPSKNEYSDIRIYFSRFNGEKKALQFYTTVVVSLYHIAVTSRTKESLEALAKMNISVFIKLIKQFTTKEQIIVLENLDHDICSKCLELIGYFPLVDFIKKDKVKEILYRLSLSQRDSILHRMRNPPDMSTSLKNVERIPYSKNMKKHHIEELRDMLDKLKHDAELLYRYGSPASSVDLFDSLSLDDRKRVIYLALTEGDKDVQNVAHYLMQKLSPAPQNLEELLAQISLEDRTELEDLMEDKQLRPKPLTTIDRQRITEELQKACNQIGFLEVEEAFWILIPSDPGEEALWIEAVGGKDEDLSRVRLPSQVMYDPKKEEKYDLITSMRRALWVLHVHNHPELPGYISSCEPSGNDRGFASQWKSVRPEIESKMKFFVVKGNSVVEYSLPQGGTKRWRI